tara:strand:- start:1199 stop:3748 length:2550 start_codon:yes stop_codon:yes gene_type:complete
MFEKEFINNLKQKYKTGGTSTNLPDPPWYEQLYDKLIDKGKSYLGLGESIYTKGTKAGSKILKKTSNFINRTPRPLTEEEKSLSYLSGIEGTSAYNKLQNLSSRDKKKLHREYEDLIEDTEGLGNAGIMSQIKTFRNLDLSGIKDLQNEAGISKSEVRDILFDKMGYDNMGYLKQQAVKTALNTKGFKKGGLSYKTGGTNLEGGVMLPIPNSNAVEFKGNTHEQGGIMLDKKTEVENNETMDKVIMKKGGKKDYFFSSYLKKGGLSFSDMHKDILANGGTQNEINILAKMQEKAAKRNPKQIARLGGVVKYATGGVNEDDYRVEEEWVSYKYENGKWYKKLKSTNSKGKRYSDVKGDIMYEQGNDPFKNWQPVRNADKRNSLSTIVTQRTLKESKEQLENQIEKVKKIENKKDKKTKTNTKVETETDEETTEMPFKTKEEGNEFRNYINEIYPEYAKEIDLDKTGSYKNTYIKTAWDKYGEEYANKDVEEDLTELEKGTYTDPEGNIYEQGRTGEWRVRWNKATLEGIPEFGEVPQDLSGWEPMQEGFDPTESGALTEFTGTMPKIEEDKEEIELTEDQQTLYDTIKKRADRRGEVPAIAAAAGIAQLGPAAYSMFHKQPAAEQAPYTRGFTNPIVAQMAKAPKLDRVNYNAERASNAAQMREINNYIDTSGGGPANIINKMMAYGKKQQGDMLIAGAESKANVAISNQEAAMKGKVAISNFERAQQASVTNAQLQQGETARMDQIGLANASARQAVKDDEEFQKYQGVNTLGTNLAGLAGDLMSYKASERMAKVMGSEGIYDRDVFRSIASKEIKKSGIPGICGGTSGIPCTDDMINKFMTSQEKEKT